MSTLEALFSSLSLDTLAVRMLATALVVMAVSWSVGKFGPLIGGALAGLPMILAPGFYFMALQTDATFVAQAAAYALISLCASQTFLLSYIAVAQERHAGWSLAGAVGVWLLTTFVLQLVPGRVAVGSVLFLLATALCIRLGRRFLTPERPAKGKTGFGLLVARGLLAGALVAVVTSASQWLGATGAGLLLAFPIGYSVVAVTVHQRFGRASITATLYSAMWGTMSLAGFSAVLSLTLPRQPLNVAFGMALTAALLITLGLVFRNRRSTR